VGETEERWGYFVSRSIYIIRKNINYNAKHCSSAGVILSYLYIKIYILLWGIKYSLEKIRIIIFVWLRRVKQIKKNYNTYTMSL